MTILRGMNPETINFSIDPFPNIMISIKIFPDPISVFLTVFPLARILVKTVVPIRNTESLFFVLQKTSFIECSFFYLWARNLLSWFPYPLEQIIVFENYAIAIENLIVDFAEIKHIFLKKFYSEIPWSYKLVDRYFQWSLAWVIFYK